MARAGARSRKTLLPARAPQGAAPQLDGDTCNLALYEDRTFPLPETFFDDYAGRPAAAAQEMSIASDVDMDPVYDLKMLKEGHPGR